MVIFPRRVVYKSSCKYIVITSSDFVGEFGTVCEKQKTAVTFQLRPFKSNSAESAQSVEKVA